MTVDPARSAQMALVRSKNTRPEMIVRRIIHAMGYRYRLHRTDLPGKPDIVLPSHRKIVEVRGCFWHQHPDESCGRARVPKTRKDFWIPKLQGNRARDLANDEALRELGWNIVVVWECETTPAGRVELTAKLQAFLTE
ncbi:DNA mismatch endonuclease Vsr [Mesorhizobium caraganae]|uniref:very short patch repair endonuclease n=1 Tax=Mesorhizobium caraganae TaxID=483206 RepID=UPI00193989ED|nr:very short patch repair endonuclease [Mesorhizobium caraganae]MBM2711060.1 DNA mismatch endonuclease Vsr [Mesorhizobium caraganae]